MFTIDNEIVQKRSRKRTKQNRSPQKSHQPKKTIVWHISFQSFLNAFMFLKSVCQRADILKWEDKQWKSKIYWGGVKLPILKHSGERGQRKWETFSQWLEDEEEPCGSLKRTHSRQRELQMQSPWPFLEWAGGQQEPRSKVPEKRSKRW